MIKKRTEDEKAEQRIRNIIRLLGLKSNKLSIKELDKGGIK